jgi:N-acetylglutamate synthase and related acetyltransferases
MNVTYRKATPADIGALIELRFAYLAEDCGEVGEEERKAISSQLSDYFKRQIGNNFSAYLAETDGKPIAAVYMAVAEKPANPAFITGKTATVLNVFTYPEYRRKGVATRLLKMLIDEAKTMNISYLELSATDDGKPLYEKLGFECSQSKYTLMKLPFSISNIPEENSLTNIL